MDTEGCGKASGPERNSREVQAIIKLLYHRLSLHVSIDLKPDHLATGHHCGRSDSELYIDYRDFDCFNKVPNEFYQLLSAIISE